MNFSNEEYGENMAFFVKCSIFIQFQIIKNQNQDKFRKSQWQKFRSTSNNVIYAERIVSGLNRFYSDHFQNTPNIKTFFRTIQSKATSQ